MRCNVAAFKDQVGFSMNPTFDRLDPWIARVACFPFDIVAVLFNQHLRVGGATTSQVKDIRTTSICSPMLSGSHTFQRFLRIRSFMGFKKASTKILYQLGGNYEAHHYSSAPSTRNLDPGVRSISCCNICRAKRFPNSLVNLISMRR